MSGIKLGINLEVKLGVASKTGSKIFVLAYLKCMDGSVLAFLKCIDKSVLDFLKCIDGKNESINTYFIWMEIIKST